MKRKFFASALTYAVAASLSVHAAVMLSSDFNTITTSGTQVNNISWTVDGITTPSSTLVFDVSLRGDDGDKIDVNQKVSGSSSAPWETFVDFQVLAGTSIDLTTLTLDWIAQNSSGALQTSSKNNDWVVAVHNRVGSTVGSELAPEIVQRDTWNPGLTDNRKAFSMDISSFGTIAAGSEYRLYLKTYVSDSPGHFVAFDDLAVNGTISLIPEPASLAMLGLGFVCALYTRRKRPAAA